MQPLHLRRSLRIQILSNNFNCKLQLLQKIVMSSRLKESHRFKAEQLDYLRLLKQKQETIKELRDLLEMIDKSDVGEQQENERIKLMERKLKEYSKQVKVLEIQNQCLISVIENNHVNLPSNKEEILQREIRELRESLSLIEQQTSEELKIAQKRMTALENDNKELQRQCDKLLKLLRQKENVDRREPSGINSHSLLTKDKDRLTLSKIKQQYNQNLKMAHEKIETLQAETDMDRQALQQKEKIIQSLQEQNQYLRNELETCINFKEKQTDISKMSENDKLVESLESQIKHLNTVMQEKSTKIIELEEDKRKIEAYCQKLKKQIESIKQISKIDAQKVLKESKQHLQSLSQKSKQIESLKKQNRQIQRVLYDRAQTIDQLKVSILKLQEQNRRKYAVIQELKLLTNKFNDRSFEEELRSLKKSIISLFMRQKEQLNGKNLQNYYVIEALYQQKMAESLKLQEEIQNLKDSLSRQQRQKSRLLEKTLNLEKNEAIYQQQLKERRNLYEALLKEKSRLEKEVILGKKLKNTHSKDKEELSHNVSFITNQIDKLVELQENRNAYVSRFSKFQ